MPETPKKYSEFLLKYGGKNIYGEPNFLLQWGLNAVRRYAVPDQFLAPYLNAWCLAEWAPPEEFGDADDWSESAWGPFPSRGGYVPRQVFKQDNEPVMLESEYLNLEVLKLFLHVWLTHKHDSLMKRAQFLRDEHLKVEADNRRQLIDRIEDGAPAFADAASFRGQLNVNSVVRQKMEQLEKNWERLADTARRFPRGGVMQQPSGSKLNVPALM